MAKARTAARRGWPRHHARGLWPGQFALGALLGSCLLLGVGMGQALAAPPSVAKMLEYAPRQEVACSTPTTAEQQGCKVELDKGTRGSGWVLKGPDGKLIRRFYASNDRNIDVWSYYRKGVEVYREVDTTGSGRPDQYRWINAGGSKWGVDQDKDGKIDYWRVISPEEVSQEVLRALATRNFARLQALLITEEDIKALGLTAEHADALRQRRKGMKERFEATIAKLTKLTEKATWVHLETGAPECIPAEQSGARVDLIKYSRGTVLFESGKANEWFQVGPMFQVGNAWKIIDAPSPGTTAVEETRDGPSPMSLDPRAQKLVEELTALDKQAQGSGPESVRHYLARADLLEKIVAAVPAKERDPWIRQVADSLASAAQASAPAETTAATRLSRLEKQLVGAMPGSNLAAYVVFRRLQADNASKLAADSSGRGFEKVQKAYLDDLAAFVKDYPRAEDAPDAMLQLGMTSELLGKEVEAKNWYTALARNFPATPHGRKAAGALTRLGLEGKSFRLAAPLLGDSSTPFDIDQMKGKVVVVYYWASWNREAASDFAKLKTMLNNRGRSVDLVCVNLDARAEEASAFLQKNPAPGTHVYQPGGLESKLAVQYGIAVLPSVFIVGRDGRCLSRSAQVSTLDDEIKKHLKK